MVGRRSFPIDAQLSLFRGELFAFGGVQLPDEALLGGGFTFFLNFHPYLRKLSNLTNIYSPFSEGGGEASRDSGRKGVTIWLAYFSELVKNHQVDYNLSWHFRANPPR